MAYTVNGTYLTLEVAKAMKSITEYINDLVAEDKRLKDPEESK